VATEKQLVLRFFIAIRYFFETRLQMDKSLGSQYLSLAAPNGTPEQDAAYANEVAANAIKAAKSIGKTAAMLKTVTAAFACDKSRVLRIVAAARSGDLSAISLHRDLVQARYAAVMSVVLQLNADSIAVAAKIESGQLSLSTARTPEVASERPWECAAALLAFSKGIADEAAIAKTILANLSLLSKHIVATVNSIPNLCAWMPAPICAAVMARADSLRWTQANIAAMASDMQPAAFEVIIRTAATALLADGEPTRTLSGALSGVGEAAQALQKKTTAAQSS
jgi:hypothetical protein